MKKLGMLSLIMGSLWLGGCSDDDKDFVLDVNRMTGVDWYYNRTTSKNYLSFSDENVLEINRFDKNEMCIRDRSVGIAEAAYREGLKYAQERRQFGKAIIEFPAVYEMLTNMEAKLQAARSVLYETSRFVDMYKAYTHIANERTLNKEEREEMKKYQKLADIFTPLLKLFSSEYANEIAYDALQIHGGSGFMKDYPIERLVRDARITNIYEGTSQSVSYTHLDVYKRQAFVEASFWKLPLMSFSSFSPIV